LFNSNNKRVLRDPREDDSPQVFYGTIGSGDLVMKNSGERDSRAAEDKIICFEMEAAGLMNAFPCLVIRGISDYADSRKNDQWQPYAAATAAAYAKELLSAVSVQEVEKLSPASTIVTVN
jgi:nucleoside phosphorylase